LGSEREGGEERKTPFEHKEKMKEKKIPLYFSSGRNKGGGGEKRRGGGEFSLPFFPRDKKIKNFSYSFLSLQIYYREGKKKNFSPQKVGEGGK